MLCPPLRATPDRGFDNLFRLGLCSSLQTIAQIHVEDPVRDAIVIGMVADPKTVRALQSLG